MQRDIAFDPVIDPFIGTIERLNGSVLSHDKTGLAHMGFNGMTKLGPVLIPNDNVSNVYMSILRAKVLFMFEMELCICP